MSVNVLKSKCTTPKKETKLFSHFTGFRNYTQFREFLQFVLPGLKRSKLVYWGTVNAKATLVDISLLFGMPTNTCGSDSGNNDNGNDNNEDKDEDDHDHDDDNDDDAHADASRGHKLDIEDEFLLFMMRLRLGLRVIDLSFCFSISEGTEMERKWKEILLIYINTTLKLYYKI